MWAHWSNLEPRRGGKKKEKNLTNLIPFSSSPAPVAMAAAPHGHTPVGAAAATSAAVSIACSSSAASCYEDDDDYGGASSSWSLSSPRRGQPYRRLLRDEAQRLRRARRGQGPGADTPRWVRRTTDQMARYVEDDRAGHVYGRHVVAAVRAVRATASRPSADMRQAMASFVTRLTFREMCVVLREQRGWRQARDFFAWMKLQVGDDSHTRRHQQTKLINLFCFLSFCYFMPEIIEVLHVFV